MKVIQKTLVAAGLATAVFATGAAQAATTTNASTATTPTYAKVIPNNATRSTVTIPNLDIHLAASEDLSVDDAISLTLSAGKWKSISNTSLADQAKNTGAAKAGTFAIASGGNGSNTVKFRVTAQPGPGEVIRLSGATADLTDLADGGKLSIQVDMTGFVGGAQTSLFSTPLTSLSVEAQAPATVVVTSNSATFDVASGFKGIKDVTAASDGSSTTDIAKQGKIDVTVNSKVGGGSFTNSVTTGTPAGEPAASDFMLTISGSMLGVADIIADAANKATSAGVAQTGTGVTGKFNVDKAAGKAYAISTGLTNNIRFKFDGKQAQSPVTFTAEAKQIANTTKKFTAATIGSGTLFTFDRNGSSFTSNSIGKLNKISITDRSGTLGGTGADGAIRISGYKSDGTAVTCSDTSTIAPNVPNNGTTVIQGSDLMTACPGAKRIEGIVNSTSVLVTNVKTTTDGATMQSGNNAAGTIISN